MSKEYCVFFCSLLFCNFHSGYLYTCQYLLSCNIFWEKVLYVLIFYIVFMAEPCILCRELKTGCFRPSEARLKQGTWRSLSSVLIIKSGKKKQPWQKLIRRRVPKQLPKSSLGSCWRSEMPVLRPFRPWSGFQKSGFGKLPRWRPWADKHDISEGSWLTDQRQAEERCPKVPWVSRSSRHSHQYLR